MAATLAQKEGGEEGEEGEEKRGEVWKRMATGWNYRTRKGVNRQEAATLAVRARARPRFLVLLALAPLIWAVRFYVPMHEGIAAASRLHLSRSRSEMCTASRGTRASASARPSLT